MRFGLAQHSGTFLLDAGAAKQRADKSSANAEPKASLLDELDKVNVPERSVYALYNWLDFCPSGIISIAGEEVCKSRDSDNGVLWAVNHKTKNLCLNELPSSVINSTMNIPFDISVLFNER